jgi:hypothetical protein
VRSFFYVEFWINGVGKLKKMYMLIQHYRQSKNRGIVVNRLSKSIKYSIGLNFLILVVGYVFYKIIGYLGDVGVSYSNTGNFIFILQVVFTIALSVIIFALLFFTFFSFYDKIIKFLK